MYTIYSIFILTVHNIIPEKIWIYVNIMKFKVTIISLWKGACLAIHADSGPLLLRDDGWNGLFVNSYMGIMVTTIADDKKILYINLPKACQSLLSCIIASNINAKLASLASFCFYMYFIQIKIDIHEISYFNS